MVRGGDTVSVLQSPAKSKGYAVSIIIGAVKRDAVQYQRFGW